MTMAAVDPDLVLIQQDGLLLETVSRRGDLSAFADEPVATLLAGLAAEADRGGMAPAERYGPSGLEPPAHRLSPAPGRFSRHSGAVVLTVAALVVGSSGVAAAVTGDPFAPFKGVTHLVTGGSDAGDGTLVADRGGKGHDGRLPDTAADIAVFNKKMTGVGPLLAHGDAESAREMLQAALSDLVASGAEIPPGLQNRVDKLTDRIDAVASGGTGDAPGKADGTSGGKANGSGKSDGTSGGKANGSGKSDGTSGGSGKADGTSGGKATGSGSDSVDAGASATSGDSSGSVASTSDDQVSKGSGKGSDGGPHKNTSNKAEQPTG
jgi:hypothetical protein